MLEINVLWQSQNLADWRAALERYWCFVRPELEKLERNLEQLSVERIRALDPAQWRDFLVDEFFRWKYTAPNRYVTTTNKLKQYVQANGLSELHSVKEKLLTFDCANVAAGLAIKIRGMGTPGMSGLLALIYPDHFGTVDQFVVKALRDVVGLPEGDFIRAMDPDRLQPNDGKILIDVMRRKAQALNAQFGGRDWTPRKIDKILWTYGRNHKSKVLLGVREVVDK